MMDIPYRDSGRYSASTIQTHKAIFKLISSLGFDPYDINDRNVDAVKNAIIERGNVRNKKYTENYISIIISTLRTFNPTTLTKTSKYFGIRRQNNDKRNIERGELLPTIRQLVTYSFESLQNYFGNTINNNYRELNMRRSELDTIIAICIILCTNIRTNEIFQLTMTNLYDIYVGNVVSIKFKKKHKSYIISKIEPLFSNVYPLLLKAIGTVLVMNNGVLRLSQSRSNNIIAEREFSAFVTSPTDVPFNSKYVISCSSNSINKTIVEFVTLLGSKQRGVSIGLKMIRTLNNTQLLKHVSPEVVALFNRHDNIATAAMYYNLPDVRNVMDDLDVMPAVGNLAKIDIITKKLNMLNRLLKNYKSTSDQYIKALIKEIEVDMPPDNTELKEQLDLNKNRFNLLLANKAV